MSEHEHTCKAACCTNRRAPNQVVCDHCLRTLERMCRGKERAVKYQARKRGEHTGRPWYRCIACNYFHHTRRPPDPAAIAAVRIRARRARRALLEHAGQSFYDQLIQSWALLRTERTVTHA